MAGLRHVKLHKTRALLSAFLYVASDELLSVVLEHRVDFVQQIVDVFLQLLAALARRGELFFDDFFALLGRRFLFALSLRHDVPPTTSLSSPSVARRAGGASTPVRTTPRRVPCYHAW